MTERMDQCAFHLRQVRCSNNVRITLIKPAMDECVVFLGYWNIEQRLRTSR